MSLMTAWSNGLQQQTVPQIPQTWCGYDSTVGYQWNRKWLVIETVNHPILENKKWIMVTASWKPREPSWSLRSMLATCSQIRLLLCAWRRSFNPISKKHQKQCYDLYITLSQFISSFISSAGPFFAEKLLFWSAKPWPCHVDSTLRSHVGRWKWSLKMTVKCLIALDMPTTRQKPRKNWIQSTSWLKARLESLFAR